MTEQNICPGCGRHCELSAPHCERGAAYARTGELPEGRRGEGHHKRVPYRELDVNDRLVDALRDLGHGLRAQYEGKASQQRILMILNSAGPMTQRDLTEYLGIQPGSASEILAKLENGGLICRSQNEADRRTVDIRLTEEGMALAQEAVDRRHRQHEEMFSCLSEEEKETLLTLMQKLRQDWKARYRGERGGHDRHDHHDHHDHDRRPRGDQRARG